jgi:UDP-galactopyranose mutase
VFAYYEGRMYPLPINLETINKFYGSDLDPRCVDKFLALHGTKWFPRTNFEEVAIAKMGRKLYSAFIEGYTRKHWGIDPQLLPTWLVDRIPVRSNYNGDYFQDFWQGVPIQGYNHLFNAICSGIQAYLGVEFLQMGQKGYPRLKVVYTGALDAYFRYRFGYLPWRGITLVTEYHDVPDYQGAAVINYPEESVPQTRIHEFRHLHPERPAPSRTVIAPEFSSDSGEAAYPMDEDGSLARRYREMAALESNTYFCGRMATYRYLNMDQAVIEALNLADSLCKRTI